MSYAANLRGWGPGWPRNRQSDMESVRTQHGQVVQVHEVIAPIVRFLFESIERRGYLIHKPGQIKDDWGYANRPIRGKGRPSNHSWGLAIDLDATRYPQGTDRNPPGWIVDLFEAYGFEWGGDWSYPDPMHFEFAGSITEARHIVAMLAASHLVDEPAPVPPSVPKPELPKPRRVKMLWRIRKDEALNEYERTAIWSCNETHRVYVGKDPNNKAVQDFQDSLKWHGQPWAISDVDRNTVVKLRDATPGS